MMKYWNSLNSIQKTQGAVVSLVAVIILLAAFGSSSRPQRNSLPVATTDAAPSRYATQTSAAPRVGSAIRPVPPTAVVDGVTYTGEQQVEALTQASRDAGMDEATARRTGEEVAALCNGNPDCLR